MSLKNLSQFQPNLREIFFGKKGFKFVQKKSHFFSQEIIIRKCLLFKVLLSSIIKYKFERKHASLQLDDGKSYEEHHTTARSIKVRCKNMLIISQVRSHINPWFYSSLCTVRNCCSGEQCSLWATCHQICCTVHSYTSFESLI